MSRAAWIWIGLAIFLGFALVFVGRVRASMFELDVDLPPDEGGEEGE